MKEETQAIIQKRQDYYAEIINVIHKLSKDDYKGWPSEQLEKIINLLEGIKIRH